MSSPALPLNDALRIVGLSHHTAPVALRERLAFRPDALERALGGLLAGGCREAAILSTCNRVEIVAVAREEPAALGERIRAFLSEFHAVPQAEFGGLLYEFKGCEAARHLFEVAASLDSQILGETEILSQSKEAYRVAARFGACGPVLHGLFERSFFLSKELRSDGGISRSQASVSSAAVALAKKVFEVEGRKILVIGTGEMATGIVRALRSAGVSEILVASRTQERAAEFAQREGGRACLMQNLAEHLAAVDIVLVSAAAPHYIVGPAQIEAAHARRRGRVLCLIDISVPRNVDPQVNELEDTYLYDIDDLEEVARDGRREREAVAARWRPRLAEEAREILRQLQEHGPRDTARKLIEHVAAIRQEILQQTRTHGMDTQALEELERALERLQGRILHGPLETLRQATREGDGADATAWVSRLFRLEAATAAAGSGAGLPEVEGAPPANPPEAPQAPGVLKSAKNAAPEGAGRRPFLSGGTEGAPQQATS